MTYKEFENLDESEQVKVLIECGVSIAENKVANQLTFLYFLETFFVVVVFCAKTDDLLQIITLKAKNKKRVEKLNHSFSDN